MEREGQILDYEERCIYRKGRKMYERHPTFTGNGEKRVRRDL